MATQQTKELMAGLRELPMPVPPGLERALGYERSGSRFLEVWWTCYGDESTWSDGVVTSSGNPWGYLAYVRHKRVAPHLVGLALGSSDEDARDHLLLDLVERKAWAGPALAVERVVVASATRPRLTPEEVVAIVQRMRDLPLSTIQEMERRMADDSAAMETLVRELDGGTG